MPKIKGKGISTIDDTPPVRTGGRVKKAKIVFDPSINNQPRKRGRATSLTGSITYSVSDKSGDSPHKLKKYKTYEPAINEVQKKIEVSNKIKKETPPIEPNISDSCMICEKVENKKDRKLIPCKDCNYKVHLACLKINFQNQNLLAEHWRCHNCTSCVVCYETAEAGFLITCCVCVDSYHLNCHSPKLIKNVNKFKWECSKCQNINKSVVMGKMPINVDEGNGELYIKSRKQEIIERQLYQNNNSEFAAKIILSEKKNDNQCKEQIKSKDSKIFQTYRKAFEDDIPDISDWTCERVYRYVYKYFPLEANVLRENEIDGSSLLLMKRSDVIRGLPLKLGPAIRLYSFIVRLQSKSNDPRLTWM